MFFHEKKIVSGSRGGRRIDDVPFPLRVERAFHNAGRYALRCSFPYLSQYGHVSIGGYGSGHCKNGKLNNCLNNVPEIVVFGQSGLLTMLI